MRCSRSMAVAVILGALCGHAVSQSSSSAPAQIGAATSSETASYPDSAAKMREGYAAYQKGQWAQALSLFREVLAAVPDNIYAHNMAANAALQLADYPAAIASFQRALELRPDEHHNLSGLMRAYALAGMTTQRDQEREHILAISRQGRLPQNFCYVFDAFQVADKKVEVSEFLMPTGAYKYRYHFNVYDASGKYAYRVALESDDLDQNLWAKQHPQESAAGQRMYSLDGYRPNQHSTYRFYDGEPPYEQVREEVKQIVSGTLRARTTTVLGAAPPPSPK